MITKKALISAAEKGGLPKKQAKAAVDIILEAIHEDLELDGEIYLIDLSKVGKERVNFVIRKAMFDLRFEEGI
ncbi:MAG: HU family DNA-binding protein [bacterium]